MNQDLIAYYRQRANEYENIYLKPERQNDLNTATSVLQSLFAEKEVLEIACGTGYWTQKIAETATSVLATDINQPVIDIARGKHYKNKVDFQVADFYNLNPPKKFDCLFGGFIWSHIPVQELDTFIAKAASLVVSGGTLVFMDNNYVHGNSHPITQVDGDENTYQTRKLENGTTHQVLKNFPARESIVSRLTDKALDISFTNLTYYWLVSYSGRH